MLASRVDRGASVAAALPRKSRPRYGTSRTKRPSLIRRARFGYSIARLSHIARVNRASANGSRSRKLAGRRVTARIGFGALGSCLEPASLTIAAVVRCTVEPAVALLTSVDDSVTAVRLGSLGGRSARLEGGGRARGRASRGGRWGFGWRPPAVDIFHRDALLVRIARHSIAARLTSHDRIIPRGTSRAANVTPNNVTIPSGRARRIIGVPVPAYRFRRTASIA